MNETLTPKQRKAAWELFCDTYRINRSCEETLDDEGLLKWCTWLDCTEQTIAENDTPKQEIVR